MKKYKHIPVLLKESIESLNIKSDGIYIDSTFGCGGHSKIILSKLDKNGKLFSLDKDPEVINIANKITDPRFKFLNINFSDLYKINLKGKVNGILFDLGLSSIQLDNPNRGFSFINDGPLDMRMNQKNGENAFNWIKKSNFKELYFVFKKFGEENFSKRIAKAIYKYNKIKIITRTKELSNLIKLNYNNSYNNKIHPATRIFQAIRIHINNEIEEIKYGLKYALKLLSTKGRLSIISFHSLEDRIVKNFIKLNTINYKYNLNSYIKYKKKKLNKLISLGKIKPSLLEIKKNYRARSAILRVAEKI
ncbi:MAG: 16S rRNA (cytosine(1402)-N(4))-methyltransferase RsmH [Enterobacteriaceae bacterium PSpicST2]|nr:MAG: 16S rRNA (cytosine(1402)-N(4))-methyltransferase RsmH [Enterobacteriaceae bacterium PSpicST2]